MRNKGKAQSGKKEDITDGKSESRKAARQTSPQLVSRRHVLSILIIVIGMLAVGMFIVRQQSTKGYDFADGLVEVRKIDSRYDTSYHIEQLNGTVVPMEKIAPLLADLDAFELRVNQGPRTNDTELLLKFIEARKEMLESERYYQVMFSYGPVGNIWDGFRCTDIPALLNVSQALNETLHHGQRAVLILDEILTVPHTRLLIGINDAKPQFYNSPLLSIKRTIDSINKSIDAKCYDIADEEKGGEPITEHTSITADVGENNGAQIS